MSALFLGKKCYNIINILYLVQDQDKEAKMRIFDLHADIGCDILRKEEQGHNDALQMDHLPKLKEGEIMGVCIASFFDGSEDWEQMQRMVEASRRQISALQPEITWVKAKEDLKDDNRIKLLMSVEGMCGIVDDVEAKIQWLYDQGVRVASLCWNEQNALANGVKGDVCQGLSALGKLAIKKMEELGMVIDVSHANEKTFWDIVEITDGPIIATHSNARRLCCHDRNLTDQQLKAIKAKGGIVGLNAARHFIAERDDQQDVAHLGAHGRYIADLIGCEHVAMGFDFMDFIPDHDNAMGKGLANAACAQNLITALKEQGFDEKQCQMIAYDNAINLLRRVLR